MPRRARKAAFWRGIVLNRSRIVRPCLTFHMPDARLRDLATLHYVLRGGPAAFDTCFGAMLPQAQRVLAGRCEVRVGDGPWRSLPRAVLTGPTHGAVRVRGGGGFVLVGTGLRPVGSAALVRVPAAELADGLCEAGAVWGDGLLAEEADAMLDDAALARGADRWLLRLTARAPETDPRIPVIDQWLAAPGRARVDVLAERLGVSGRHVERLTAWTHGGPPRLLAVKHRALRAGAELALGRACDWAAAAREDYADQPHFIRHFRRFVGETPGRYVRGGGVVAARAAFIGRARTGARDPLALWS